MELQSPGPEATRIPLIGDTCTGEAITTIGTFFFVIADNGKLSRIIATTPGMTVDGEGIRQ